MQYLLGLDDRRFLEMKKTEKWISKRTKDYQTKEKHVDFAKELFQIWDEDGSGVLELNELAIPLVSLGLSTDVGFVAKLIESLTDIGSAKDEIRISLKDFVKIFNVDKVGEKMSDIVKEAWRIRKNK